MLESHFGTDIVAHCLNDPENAFSIAKSSKKAILRKYFTNLLSTSLSNHLSTKLVASVAESSSRRQLWDLDLDKGGKGTGADPGGAWGPVAPPQQVEYDVMRI